MKKELQKITNDIRVIGNSIEMIEDTNCILIMKHLLLVINDIVKYLKKDNICKYCLTNKTYNEDPNVLCKECQKTLGHSFYDEL